MKRGAIDSGPETSPSTSIHSSEEEEQEEQEEQIKVTPLEVSHAHMLLKLCLLSTRVRDLEDVTVAAYRDLIIRKSCTAWEGMPRGWLQWSAREKGVGIVDFLHSDCCPVGNVGIRLKCTVTLELEHDVVACVNNMITDKAYQKRMFSRYRSKSAAVKDDTLPRVKDFESSKRDLARLKETLINQYFPRAAWKRELDAPMTPLESLLTDPDSMVSLKFFKEYKSNNVVESVCHAMQCKFNPHLCRGCYKPIVPGGGNKSGRRKRQPKKKKKRGPLSCRVCRSVYFCSEDCMISGTMGRHKTVECPMLVKYRDKQEL